MRLRPCCVVVLMFLLAPTTTLANDHVARIAGGYSKLKGSSFDGAHGSVEVALPFTQDILAIVVDSSIHGGTEAGDDVTKATALFGPRVVYRPGDKRVVVFAHILGGYYRSHVGSDATNGSAGGAGGGIDFLIGAAGLPPTPKPGAPATARSGWIASFQADWVRIAGENSLRMNAGIGYRYR